MDEKEFASMFKYDFSAGTESFRDALLEQCFEALREGEDGLPIADDELDLLAAAGDPTVMLGQRGETPTP